MAVGLLALAGCASSDPPRFARFRMPKENHAALAPASNYNLITLRPAPTTGRSPGGGGSGSHSADEPDVFCISPSPDWAFALAKQAAFSGSGSVPSGPSASLSGSASSTEAVTAALGRTAGVVALRDGLYQACQGYANGLIGRRAYALILSQYGNVLANVLAQSSGATSSSSPAAASGSTAAPAASVGVAVAMTPTASPSTSSSAGASPGTSSTAGSSSTATSTPGAAQVAIMQQAHIQALVVACLNESDPSLPGFRTDQENTSNTSNKSNSPHDSSSNAEDLPVLNRPFCNKLLDDMESSVGPLLKPVIVAQAGTGSSGAQAGAPATPSCPDTTPVKGVYVRDYQVVLRSQGLFTGPLDGKGGWRTTAALLKYQQAAGLCASGFPDKATLTRMKLLGGG